MKKPIFKDFETIAPHQIAPGMRIEIHFLSGPAEGRTLNLWITATTNSAIIDRDSAKISRAELDHAEIRNLDAIQQDPAAPLYFTLCPAEGRASPRAFFVITERLTGKIVNEGADYANVNEAAAAAAAIIAEIVG